MATDTDSLTAALDAIGKRDKEVWDYRDRMGALEAIEAAKDDVPRLLAALDEILNLHVPKVLDSRPPFRYCSRCSGHPKWPCPEVAAITRALLGEETRDE